MSRRKKNPEKLSDISSAEFSEMIKKMSKISLTDVGVIYSQLKNSQDKESFIVFNEIMKSITSLSSEKPPKTKSKSDKEFENFVSRLKSSILENEEKCTRSINEKNNKNWDIKYIPNDEIVQCVLDGNESKIREMWRVLDSNNKISEVLLTLNYVKAG